VTATVRFTRGLKTLIGMTNPTRFGPILDGEMKRANFVLGAQVRREMRRRINERRYHANAALTTFIKGSTKPLADDGDLFGDLSIKVVSAEQVEIGIMRSSRSANVAAIVHEGAVVPITERMRAMFKYLSLKSHGRNVQLKGRALELWGRRPEGGWKGFRRDRNEIIIPPRPFAEFVLEPEWLAKAQEQWGRAIDRAFRKFRK